MHLKFFPHTAIACSLLASVSMAVASSYAQQNVHQQAVHSTLAIPEQRIALDIPAGHIAQISFVGEGVHLDLRDAQGQHLRRLAEDGRGAITAMWRSQGSDQEQLWVVASDISGPRSFQLKLLKTWPSTGPEKLHPEVTPMGPRLQALSEMLQQGGDTQYFWQEMEKLGTPLVEPWNDGQLLVTFLWRDQGNDNVRLFGSPSGNHNPLRKLEGSDVWWTSIVMDPRARLSYGLAPDVPEVADTAMQRRMILSTLQRDPLNSRVFPLALNGKAVDIYQGRSLLELPKAPAHPWTQDTKQPFQGRLQRHVMQSQVLGNTRDVFTYLPRDAAPQALLVLFDAHAYLKDVSAPHIIDWLMEQQLLPPTAMVLVGNASAEARNAELPPNPKFAQFMAQELMPWVRQQGMGQLADRTVVAGSSYGGLVSSYLGLMHPELFGNVLSMSGSYWWAPADEPAGWMQRAWQAVPGPMHHVHFYLDAGLYETSRGGRRGILETSRELGQVLRDRGLSVTQREWVSGHDYAQWQASLACGLVALLASEKLEDPRLQACTPA